MYMNDEQDGATAASQRSGAGRPAERQRADEPVRLWTGDHSDAGEGAQSLIYLLQDGTNTRFETLEAPIFADMALSFSPATANGRQTADAAPAATAAAGAESAATAGDDLLVMVAALFAVIGLVGIVLLVRRGRRGQAGALSAGLLFAAVFCLYGIMAALHSMSATALAPFGPLGHIPVMGIVGIQSAVALATLMGILWACATRRVTARWGEVALLALILNGALQVVSWVYDLLGAAMQVSSRFTIAGAVIIILALLWDVTMSGETITNVDGAIFPRRSRVLLFFGYMSFTATNLLYFSTLTVQATGAPLEAQFESDVWVQNGLMLLGVPLLLTLFLLRMGRWRHASGDTTSAGDGTGAAGIPSITSAASTAGATTQDSSSVAAATVMR